VSDGDPVPVSVRGGTHGIDARCDDLADVARLFGHAASDIAAVSWSLQRYLFDLGIMGSALLDPGGAASFEFELARALDGPHGVTMLALECAALSARLYAAAAAYRLADHLDSSVHTVLDGVIELPRAAIAAEATLLFTGNPDRAVDALVTGDPALADDVVAAAAVLARAAPPGLTDLALADGHPRVRALGIDSTPSAQAAPRNLTDLMRALATRDRGRPGEIGVSILASAGGRRLVIVDIPGTKSWNPLPNSDVTSVVTDVRAMTGRTTSYERGLFEALHRAGVRPSDDVMLVGHSEGGMIAVQAATDAQRSGTFRITHVVTAGAPIGRIAGHVPRSVAVLALENAHDVVPHLDGRPNPPAPNVTTVTVDHDSSRILGNHEVEDAYILGARDADASRDPSVRDFLAGATGFLHATSASTQRFVITREY
jgi:hypothetical protein